MGLVSVKPVQYPLNYILNVTRRDVSLHFLHVKHGSKTFQMKTQLKGYLGRAADLVVSYRCRNSPYSWLQIDVIHHPEKINNQVLSLAEKEPFY